MEIPKEIEIIVKGRMGTGKTTFVCAIADLLSRAGVAVTIEGEEEMLRLLRSRDVRRPKLNGYNGRYKAVVRSENIPEFDVDEVT